MAHYVRFDWAMKRLLRDKANYVVLEGLLSSLLNKEIKITEILEGESNQDAEDDKQNRVDVLATDEKGVLYLIEVQNNSETAYFQRMLFGTSKLITQYNKLGCDYGQIRKVYSVNLVYFNLGMGKDYVYEGTTEFRGIHTDEVLNLSPFQMQQFDADGVKDLFPKYYILKIDGFDKVAKTPLDEWMYFLKDGSIADKPKAPGLERAKEVMLYDTMSESERRHYDRVMMDAAIIRDNVETARVEGRAEGEAKGRAEGRAEGEAKGRAEEKIGIARNLKSLGLPTEQIAQVTGLRTEEILRLN